MRGRRYTDDELLPLSGIQHFYFCRRQWALIHIEREWEDNLRTAEGHILHEKADDPFARESRGDIFISRAFPLVSFDLGLYGVADVIEYRRSDRGITLQGHDGQWLMKPIEYKRGKPKVDRRDEVQLCAQAMCLEEMFDVVIEKGAFYYHENRRRLEVQLPDDLKALVEILAEEMHEVFRKGITPPAERSQHCTLCSLIDVCIPKLTKKPVSVAQYVRKHVKDACDHDV